MAVVVFFLVIAFAWQFLWMRARVKLLENWFAGSMPFYPEHRDKLEALERRLTTLETHLAGWSPWDDDSAPLRDAGREDGG